eukprot:41093-Rhodomonas_salina.2
MMHNASQFRRSNQKPGRKQAAITEEEADRRTSIERAERKRTERTMEENVGKRAEGERESEKRGIAVPYRTRAMLSVVAMTHQPPPSTVDSTSTAARCMDPSSPIPPRSTLLRTPVRQISTCMGIVLCFLGHTDMVGKYP